MSSDQTKIKPDRLWPDLTEAPLFTDLPYEHARLNILEVECRVMERYLRSQRDADAIRERMQQFYPTLAHFLEHCGLATAMHLIEPGDTRLADEQRYYQDLNPELGRLLYQAFKGLLKQDAIYDIGQVFGKTNLLALYYQGLLADEAETERAIAEYRIMLQFKKRYFPAVLIERTASHFMQLDPYVFFEPDYSAADFLWIEDRQAAEIIDLRRAMTADERMDRFSQLAYRRLGMNDDQVEERNLARDTISHWLVPIAAYDRNRRSSSQDRDVNQLYPHPVSTVRLAEDLPEPVISEDLAALAQVWGDPAKSDTNGVYANPLSEDYLKMLDSIFPGELKDSLEQLQMKGYLRSGKSGQTISLWLAQSALPFAMIKKVDSTNVLAESTAHLGYVLSLLATREEDQLMLRLPAKDYQLAQATSLLAMTLDHLEALYADQDAAQSVRDAYLMKILNQLIYSAMLDEFQDFIYSQSFDAKEVEAYWLYLMERWYPDLADNHEWLLAQEQSWRQIPSLIMTPYQSTVEYAANLSALILWDMAAYDMKRASKAYLAFISQKRSSSLADALREAALKSPNDVDAIKRLAYQISFALGY